MLFNNGHDIFQKKYIYNVFIESMRITFPKKFSLLGGDAKFLTINKKSSGDRVKTLKG